MQRGRRRRDLVSSNFGVSCSELFSLRAARSGEKSINKTFPSSEPALIDHAESIFGEEGKRFAGKAELERGV